MFLTLFGSDETFLVDFMNGNLEHLHTIQKVKTTIHGETVVIRGCSCVLGVIEVLLLVLAILIGSITLSGCLCVQ